MLMLTPNKKDMIVDYDVETGQNIGELVCSFIAFFVNFFKKNKNNFKRK